MHICVWLMQISDERTLVVKFWYPNGGLWWGNYENILKHPKNIIKRQNERISFFFQLWTLNAWYAHMCKMSYFALIWHFMENFGGKSSARVQSHFISINKKIFWFSTISNLKRLACTYVRVPDLQPRRWVNPNFDWFVVTMWYLSQNIKSR